MISIITIEKDDDRGCQFRIVICFRDLGRLCAFVCELFPITRINQDFRLAIKTTCTIRYFLLARSANLPGRGVSGLGQRLHFHWFSPRR